MENTAFGVGVLQPALSYRFRVVFNSRHTSPEKLEQHQYNLLTQQVHDVQVDYLNDTLNLSIQQSILGDEHELITELLKGTSLIRIDVMNGAGGVYHSMEFYCKPTSHNISFNYAERSTVVTHKLQFEIMTKTLLTNPVQIMPVI